MPKDHRKLRWWQIRFDWAEFVVALPEGAIPLWLLSAAVRLVGRLPEGVHALRRRRRAKAGCCPHCGYDLRGGQRRCPECWGYFQRI